MAGSATLLWGGVNSLLVVAHFPLLSIILPGNAKVLYQMIYGLCTFDLVPMDSIEEELNAAIGEFDHSD